MCFDSTQKMKEILLSEKIIHTDETVIQVLHEEGRKATAESRMWAYCNGKHNDHSNIIFDYCTTRKGENAKNYIQGCYIVRDGYVLPEVKHCDYLTYAKGILSTPYAVRQDFAEHASHSEGSGFM